MVSQDLQMLLIDYRKNYYWGLFLLCHPLISDRGICCYPNLLHLKDENGNRRTTEEKVAVYWSKNLSCVQNRKTKSFMIS